MTSNASTKEIDATEAAVAEQAPSKIWQPGSCHCGAVKFEVLYESIYPPSNPSHTQPKVVSCNCSICCKNGYLLIYAERNEVKWISGWEEMKTYRFYREVVDHRFCGVCGSSVCTDFAREETLGNFGINVRMIQDVDLERVDLQMVNGRDWWPDSEPVKKDT